MLTAALASGGTVAAAATAAVTPAGGTFHVFLSTGGRSPTVAPILLTGAIGDYGRATTINKRGAVTARGNYLEVAAQKGTFEVYAAAFDRRVNKAIPRFNKTTCSLFLTGSGPATLLKGTGRYTGIAGTLHLTLTLAAVVPRLANGTCHPLQGVRAISEYSFITGAGHVTF